MGIPAESRTVPETMTAGRDCGEVVCANADNPLVKNIAASAAKAAASGRIVDRRFIAGIFSRWRTLQEGFGAIAAAFM